MDFSELHEKSVVIDTHNDALSHLIDETTWLPKFNLKENLENVTKYGHVDLDKLKRGSLNAAFFAICAPERFFPGKVLSRTLAMLNAIFMNIKDNSDSLELIVAGTGELETVVKEKTKIAVVVTLEGIDSLDETRGIELLRQFDDLGIKVMGLTWNYSNQVAEGLNSVYSDGKTKASPPGLSPLGEKVVKEMNKLGIVIDVSHLHSRSFYHVLKISDVPVIASHSGVKGVYEHRRNFSDEELYALADKGGVIQINFASNFLSEIESEASVGRIVDHVEYAKNLVGRDHVGLGSDFDGTKVPPDLKDFSEYPKITREMMNRGFSDDEIEKILGKNILKVMKEIEAKSSKEYKIDTAIDTAGTGKVDTGNFSLDQKVFGKKATGIEIEPHFEMGTIFEDKDPLLGATINEYEDKAREDKIKIIMNGQVFTPDDIDSWSHPIFKKTSKAVYFKPPFLDQEFNVITFSIHTELGKELRATRIYHIKQN